ncbi:TetR/AcrR family transcriptional regulator [Amycolatopsis cihanbeyliensis]|uniref:TetR family transcriptional regulator n=1 Tax=Amycolatopsis cihanbeyliensis TaxID=1128664 RepID=A0A542DQT4_AMYCI|nr:TetR/AcrR family transcriptional regulator [Amycolatopsis cihanbeyliensis]TQJ05315.1 TetR family transcriptional regulator [Amycolatopsis cihanbeyliensis]
MSSGRQGKASAGESPRRQRRRERNRAALLDAAYACFRRGGFVSTTISQITEEADVAHGTFYSYFTTKDEVFTELVDRLLEDLFTVVNGPRQEPSVRRRLSVALSAFFQRCHDEREILLALHQASRLHEDYARKWERFRERLRRQVEHDLGWLSRNQYLPGTLRVDLVSTVITRMIEGVALHIVDAADADVEALADTTATLYYDAVFRPASGSEDITLS